MTLTLEEKGAAALEAAHNIAEHGKSLIGRRDGPLLIFRLLRSIKAHPGEHMTWHRDHGCSPHTIKSSVDSAFDYLRSDKLIERHRPDHAWGKSVYYRLTPAGETYLAGLMRKMPKIVNSDDYAAIAGKSSKKKKGDHHNECSHCTCAG